MYSSTLDVAVVGAGHAGLCISYLLKKYNLTHAVFEKGQTGDSWIKMRWDSFRMNTPNKVNELPGMEGYFTDPEGFCSANEFTEYLKQYTKNSMLPIVENCEVLSIVRDPDSNLFFVSISEMGVVKQIKTRQVVIASGNQNKKVIPEFSTKLSPDIVQQHSSEYRKPENLPIGAVLVVGSGQSGAQIAEDLAESGRDVYISSSKVGRIPRRYRGKDIVEWLITTGFYNISIENITDSKILKGKQPQVSGVGPKGHTLSLQILAAKGVRVLGSIDKIEKEIVYFQNNAATNVRYGDAFSKMIKDSIDEYINTHQLSCPPSEYDSADIADDTASFLTEIISLNLKRNNISSIIWATGFTGDFNYLKLHVFKNNGEIKHTNGISEIQGLYFLGLPWLRKRKSGIIYGVKEDAELILERILKFNRDN